MSPRLLLLVSLGFSLAFNIVWACSRGVATAGGVLSVAAAAACTLIVPAGLHLWPQIPAPTWSLRALRAVVMTGICVSAAITSFSHSVEVLVAAGWTDLTAWSVTGGAELLVALSTMALRTDHPTPAARTVAAHLTAQAHHPGRKTTPAASSTPPAPTARTVASQGGGESGSATPPHSHSATPPPTSPAPAVATPGDDLVREAVVWAQEEAGEDGVTPGWRRILREFPDLTEHRAKTAAAQARPDHPTHLRRVQ